MAADCGGRKASQANIIRGRGTEDGLLPTPDCPAYETPVSVAGCRSQVAGRGSQEESTEVKGGGGRYISYRFGVHFLSDTYSILLYLDVSLVYLECILMFAVQYTFKIILRYNVS